MVYFIVTVYVDEEKGKGEYEKYIQEVRPIVESYGGKYLIRSEKITPLGSRWEPTRVIIIEWNTRKELERCFASDQYRSIVSKRENSVDSRAVIVEE